MATMIGVLPGAPRPRLPPERPPPREASSISTRPVRRLPASRSIITRMSLCASFQAVFWVTPRPSSRLEIPPLLCVRWVHGAEPSAQRHLGRGENRAGDQRGLPSAGRALVEVAGLDDAVLLPAAAGADKAARPAPAKHSLPAPIRASVKFIEARLAEPFLKLNAIARHASTPPASARVHDLYQMPAG